MGRIGRNSPCPCGSNRKYKRCCLPRERLDKHRWQGLDLAMDWLLRRYGDTLWAELAEDYWGPLGTALMARKELPEELSASLQENSDDWLIAQGHVLTAKARVPVIDLLLDSGGPALDGPALDEAQRQWLASFAANPLGIYEVREVSRVDMTVADLARPGQPLLRVAGAAIPPEADEASALVAMRLLPEGELWTRTVAWYPFERSLLPQIEEAIETARADWETVEDQRWSVSAQLAELWWDEKARAHLSPQELEMARKSEFRHVTDSYRVADWDRLCAVLAAADRLVGDRDVGWTHFGPAPAGEEPFWSHALNPGTGDRLELFATSELQADEGREWLAALAGDAVVFERREIRSDAEDEIPSMLLEGCGAEPATTKTAHMQALLEKIYADWAEQPLPILNGKPPARAVFSEEGRQSVAKLLRSYEQSEREAARKDLREPASFRFLWAVVGLDSEDSALQ